MVTYKLASPFNGIQSDVIIRSDGAQIPNDPDNTDYIAYLAWIELGNIPLPADSE